MIGAQASQEQQDKILGCIATGREEGAEILLGGNERQEVGQGFYIEPTILKVLMTCAPFRKRFWTGTGGDHVQRLR